MDDVLAQALKQRMAEIMAHYGQHWPCRVGQHPKSLYAFRIAEGETVKRRQQAIRHPDVEDRQLIEVIGISAKGTAMGVYSTAQFLGIFVGGALGGAVGAEVGGRNGAIIGSGVGAAVGTAIATNDHQAEQHKTPQAKVEVNYRTEKKHPHKQYHCPPGQAKKGRR